MPVQYPGNSATKAARAKAGGGFESDIESVLPGAPTFTTSATATSITATITDAAGATSYESSVDGTTWVAGLTVSGLTAETAYTFRVRGINADGTGPSASVSETTAAAAAAPSISSVTNNQNGTLTVSGSNFGTKETGTTEILYDGGDFVRENGVENTYRAGLADGSVIDLTGTQASEVYASGTGGRALLRKTGLRGAGCTAKYAPNPANLDTGALWFGNAPAERTNNTDISYHPRYHIRFYGRYKYAMSKMKTLANWAVTSGTFVLPDLSADPTAVGEQVSLGDSGITGYLLKVSTSDGGTVFATVYTPTDTNQFEVPDGTVITGLTSGATATIAAGTAGTDNWGPEKLFRAYSQGSGGGSRLTMQHYDLYLDFEKLTFTDMTQQYENEWFCLDIVVDFEGDYIKLFSNGSYVGEINNLDEDMVYGLYTAAFGWQSVRGYWNYIEAADIYVDHDLEAVYLGDAATWSNCTVTEIQPISWGSDISVTLRTGALNTANPVYVYVTNKGVPAATDTGTEVQL